MLDIHSVAYDPLAIVILLIKMPLLAIRLIEQTEAHVLIRLLLLLFLLGLLGRLSLSSTTGGGGRRSTARGSTT